ncbi:MAG: hypothetical protein ACYTF0_05900, partial [Planctomycetota bacterium]
LISGAVHCHPDSGLLVAEDGDHGTLVAEENLDRLTLESILLDRGKLAARSRTGQALLSQLRHTRHALDIAAGGHPWTADLSTPSESTSTNAATTSSSTTTPFTRRGR